jgi:hypothetical protein
MRKLLFAATHPQRFSDQILFAKDLRNVSNGTITPYFFVSDRVRGKHPALLENFPFPILNPEVRHPDPQVLQRGLSRPNFIQVFYQKLVSTFGLRYSAAMESLKSACSQSFLYDPLLRRHEDQLFAMLRGQYDRIMQYLKGIRFDACFVCGDRHRDLEPIFLRICQDLRIPVLIPYMAFFGEEEDLVPSKIRKGYLVRGDSLWGSRYIVEAQKRHQGHIRNNCFYYPHIWANALDRFGVLSGNPWFMGSGKSDILCLPNVLLRDHYVSNGVPAEKIRIIGDTSFDRIYQGVEARENLRATLSRKYRLSVNRKFIVCALPQLAEHGILLWDRHWDEIHFLCNALTALGHNVLLSLHPKVERNIYGHLATHYNCAILDERLSVALPVADMFVATNSSTVFWAVMLGIKAVVLNYYGVSTKMFNFLNTVTVVTEKQTLPARLSEALTLPVDFTQDWQALSRDQVFDGKTIQRYVDLIEEVSGK